MIESPFVNSSRAEIVVDFVQIVDDEYEKVDPVVLSIGRGHVNFVIGIVQAATFQIGVQLTERI